MVSQSGQHRRPGAALLVHGGRRSILSVTRAARKLFTTFVVTILSVDISLDNIISSFYSRSATFVAAVVATARNRAGRRLRSRHCWTYPARKIFPENTGLTSLSQVVSRT